MYMYTHTHYSFWVLFLLMGSKGTSFSWCGVIEAAVLKGCVPLLLLRHKVMQTPSQLLTQEVSMVHCPLMREANSYLIFVFWFRCCPFDPCGAIQCSVVHLCPHGEHHVQILSNGPFFIYFLETGFLCPIATLFWLILYYSHFWNSKYLKVKGHKRAFNAGFSPFELPVTWSEALPFELHEKDTQQICYLRD